MGEAPQADSESNEAQRRRVNRVVVGVDASEESRAALRWAIWYSGITGARLEVVHGWNVGEEFQWLQSMPPPASPTAVASEALTKLVEELVPHGSNTQIETAVVEGHAAKVLVERASGASVLVLGSRGHGGFDGLLLGSVTSHCAMHAPCSVMIVRPTDTT